MRSPSSSFAAGAGASSAGSGSSTASMLHRRASETLLLAAAAPNVYAWFPSASSWAPRPPPSSLPGETWIIHVARGDRGAASASSASCGRRFARRAPSSSALTRLGGWDAVPGRAASCCWLPCRCRWRKAGAEPAACRPDRLLRLFRAGPATLLAVVLLAVFDSVNDSFLPLYGLPAGWTSRRP